jgi:hypothetical protein
MAGLEWKDVLIIAGVATVGFTLLSYWWSGVMAKRNWSYQMKAKKRDAKTSLAPAGQAAAASDINKQ